MSLITIVMMVLCTCAHRGPFGILSRWLIFLLPSLKFHEDLFQGQNGEHFVNDEMELEILD